MRHQERVGDLFDRQAGQRTQRERDARLDSQRRMATGEDQAEPVVRDRWHRVISVPELGVCCRRERRQLAAVPTWFSAEDLIAAPWESERAQFV